MFRNIKAIVTAAGGGFDDVVKATVFLTDLSHLPGEQDHGGVLPRALPARAAVGVASLPRGAQVEVECIVAL